jgi:hypothetical protein
MKQDIEHEAGANKGGKVYAFFCEQVVAYVKQQYLLFYLRFCHEFIIRRAFKG